MEYTGHIVIDDTTCSFYTGSCINWETGAILLFALAQDTKGSAHRHQVAYFEADATVADVITFIEQMFEYNFVAEVLGDAVAAKAEYISCPLPWDNLKHNLETQCAWADIPGHRLPLSALKWED